jgi:hypothetical protein
MQHQVIKVANKYLFYDFISYEFLWLFTNNEFLEIPQHNLIKNLSLILKMELTL